jgi:hypothetical protein
MNKLRLIAACFALATVAAWHSSARADYADVLEAECHAQMQLGSDGCACIAQRARDMLNDRQQAMVVAAVTKDDATRDKLQSEMSPEELTTAATFMTETPGICGQQ